MAAVGERAVQRLGTGFVELDRVLGGGLVPGSLVLVGGDPGIGKSTFCCKPPLIWPNAKAFSM